MRVHARAAVSSTALQAALRVESARTDHLAALLHRYEDAAANAAATANGTRQQPAQLPLPPPPPSQRAAGEASQEDVTLTLVEEHFELVTMTTARAAPSGEASVGRQLLAAQRAGQPDEEVDITQRAAGSAGDEEGEVVVALEEVVEERGVPEPTDTPRREQAVVQVQVADWQAGWRSVLL